MNLTLQKPKWVLLRLIKLGWKTLKLCLLKTKHVNNKTEILKYEKLHINHETRLFLVVGNQNTNVMYISDKDKKFT